ncbi:septal ring lytic transglycosylase RlpA family protein [Prevotella sp. AM34-19LB]|uniref:septal ring lytic transglycosylase RlpA family protein n=1 Tax=Prevotella sp. AM34-19LB TaxID=2292364 RepID=UPI000E5C9C64|nr:septal ring lytic transglycosylase RlpA family protein [Prevotella sp. AM34-19LB]RHC77136.1 septal ring lytic transglycosylase RlpA family protein [Prevotella sp. AM34-19LB]
MKRRLFIIALLSTFLSTLSCIPCCGQKHQRGKASYYSKRATGARSASGQRIHHDSLTCAHRYYPFGTMLKVTNLRNDKSVIVEVIDRGPFGRGRIIDLSWAAAKEIDMISQGVATVKVERLDNPVPFKPEDSKLPKIDFEMAEFEPDHYSKRRKRQGKRLKSRSRQRKKLKPRSKQRKKPLIIAMRPERAKALAPTRPERAEAPSPGQHPG